MNKNIKFVVGTAIIVIAVGKITQFGPAESILETLPADTPITHYHDSIITAGFIDSHVHYPQTQIIGAFGKQLIDWLNKYTFIAEQQFKSKEHSSEVSKVFLHEF